MFYKSVQKVILVSSKIQEEAGEWKVLHKGFDIIMTGIKHEAVSKADFENMTNTDGRDSGA
jgi:hypothetical protein